MRQKLSKLCIVVVLIFFGFLAGLVASNWVLPLFDFQVVTSSEHLQLITAEKRLVTAINACQGEEICLNQIGVKQVVRIEEKVVEKIVEKEVKADVSAENDCLDMKNDLEHKTARIESLEQTIRNLDAIDKVVSESGVQDNAGYGLASAIDPMNSSSVRRLQAEEEIKHLSDEISNLNSEISIQCN